MYSLLLLVITALDYSLKAMILGKIVGSVYVRMIIVEYRLSSSRQSDRYEPRLQSITIG